MAKVDRERQRPRMSMAFVRWCRLVLVVAVPATSSTFADDVVPERLDAAAYRRIVGRYLRREWEAAEQSFRSLNGQQENTPAKVLFERCGRYLQDPPPPDWTGVVNMD